MIEVENVSKSYGGFEAVSNVSFTVKEGETLGFLGPNGAGKTTTMRMITGYLPTSSGQILIDGKCVCCKDRRIRKKIGYLPETAPLYPFYTVREFLYFVADLKRVKRRNITDRVNYAIKRCGLGAVKDRLISHLSKGYKQRVGIAQAIIHNPKILILDEPTVGLDPTQIIEVRDMIRELRENHTIILCSHILTEVSITCDRVLIINNGKIAVEDSTENIELNLLGAKNIYLETKAALSVDNTRELMNIDGVKTVDKEGGGLLLTMDRNTDIRSELAEFVVQKGWGLLEIGIRKATLEDVFMDVVSAKDEGGSA